MVGGGNFVHYYSLERYFLIYIDKRWSVYNTHVFSELGVFQPRKRNVKTQIIER